MTLPKRTCRECGTTFQPSHGHERFCSDECRDARNKAYARAYREAHKTTKPLVAINCVECGAEFKPNHHTTKSCSAECARKRRQRMSVEHTRVKRAVRRELGLCANCGGPSPTTVVCHKCQPPKGTPRRTKYAIGTRCLRCKKPRASMEDRMTKGYCGTCYSKIREIEKTNWIRANPDYLFEFAMNEIRKP